MVNTNYSLKEYNTFGLDVSAKLFFEYDSVHELVDFLHNNEYKNENVFFLGGGSNVLFTKNYEGLVLHSKITGFEDVYEEGNHIYIRVGAGVEWDDFVAWAVENDLGGVENLSHIPGHVGASPIQNIGAYGVEAKDTIDVVEAVNYESGKIYKFLNSECDFGYRDSIFKNALKGKYIITRVTFKLTKKHKYVIDYGNVIKHLTEHYGEPTLKNIRNAIIDIRTLKLPDHHVKGNAGSFFKNPVIDIDDYKTLQEKYPNIPCYETESGVKVPAAWLIDQCGLKGHELGGAMVHTKQPLVIVNNNNATAEDIVELSELVKAAVKKRFNINLSPEVNILG